MRFLISMLRHIGWRQTPKLSCGESVWKNGVLELHRRTGGRRESGAFLLGRTHGAIRRIEQFLYYDDIDPTCFRRGIVEFDGAKLGLVWEYCRNRGLSVIADVHVHPGGYWQSQSDQHNPIIPQAGHLALILPNYAAGDAMPGRIGIYEYLGARQWLDHSAAGTRVFHVGEHHGRG